MQLKLSLSLSLPCYSTCVTHGLPAICFSLYDFHGLSLPTFSFSLSLCILTIAAAAVVVATIPSPSNLINFPLFNKQEKHTFIQDECNINTWICNTTSSRLTSDHCVQNCFCHAKLVFIPSCYAYNHNDMCVANSKNSGENINSANPAVSVVIIFFVVLWELIVIMQGRDAQPVVTISIQILQFSEMKMVLQQPTFP